MSAWAAGHGSIGTDAFHSPTAPPLPPRGNPRRTAAGPCEHLRLAETVMLDGVHRGELLGAGTDHVCAAAPVGP